MTIYDNGDGTCTIHCDVILCERQLRARGSELQSAETFSMSGRKLERCLNEATGWRRTGLGTHACPLCIAAGRG